MRFIINKWKIALWGCVLSHFIVFSLMGIWRHWGYMTSLFDLGCFDQAIWTASQGESLLNSINTEQTMNWLGFHFQPILYIFVPLYKIVPSVHWLTLSQSAALSFSALPIFSIALHITHSEMSALVWTLIYLLNPFLISAATWDFHEVSLAVFFICLGLSAITKKRLVLLIISSLFLLACKEHFGITIAGLGLTYGIVNKNLLVSVGFSVVGIMVMAIIIGIIMPYYSPTGQHLMFKPLSNMDSSTMRYGWLGESLSAIALNITMHPLAILKTVFVSFGGWHYVFLLFLPFLFLSFLSPIWILPSIGDILANLLSANPMPRSLFSYHSVTIVPFLIVASISGFQYITPYLKTFSSESVMKLLLYLALVIAYYVAPFPLTGAINFWQPKNVIADLDSREAIIKKIIGNDAVSVQANVGAHFTHRNSIYSFPNRIEKSDFIVLRLDSPTLKTAPDNPAEIGTLSHHLHLRFSDYLSQIELLLRNNNFQLLYWDDPWAVFGKGQNRRNSAAVEQIRLKIQAFRNKG